MLTATASPIDRVVVSNSRRHYIAKPCETARIDARIRSVLRRSAPQGRRRRKPLPPRRRRNSWCGSHQMLDLEAQALRDEEATSIR